MVTKPKKNPSAASPPPPRSSRHPRPGRKPILNAQHVAVLRAIVSERPHCTIGLLTHELLLRTGVGVNPVTVRKALRNAAIELLPPLRGKAAVGEGETDRLRREFGGAAAAADKVRNTDLTNAQWKLVADLFERGQERRGVPATYSRRDMVNACYHLLRSGCSWRHLPARYPPWQSVYKAFSRWTAAGLFDTMRERLRQQQRDRADKPAGKP